MNETEKLAGMILHVKRKILIKVNVKLSLCLSKYHTMKKSYPLLN